MPFEHLSRRDRRAMQSYARAEAAKRPERLREIPKEAWPPSFRLMTKTPIKAWQSRQYLAQLFDEGAHCERTTVRLSVNRVTVNDVGRWDDGLSWDELMQVKREVGYGDWYAIEIYPRDCDIVNVGNLRHLWIFSTPLSVGWFRDGVNEADSQ
jgi:hypothetical protein